MEQKNKTFQPIGLMGIESKVCELVEDLKAYISEDKAKEIEAILDFTNNKLDVKKKEYEDIVEYVSQFFGKYVHMKFYYNANYSSTREIDPLWQCDYEANVFLYSFSPINDCLFGIYNEINNPYDGGVRDKCINLYDKVEEHKFEINQITAEEFLNTAKESVSNCLTYRLKKIKSGFYELTKTGYQRKTYDKL